MQTSTYHDSIDALASALIATRPDLDAGPPDLHGGMRLREWLNAHLLELSAAERKAANAILALYSDCD